MGGKVTGGALGLQLRSAQAAPLERHHHNMRLAGICVVHLCFGRLGRCLERGKSVGTVMPGGERVAAGAHCSPSHARRALAVKALSN